MKYITTVFIACLCVLLFYNCKSRTEQPTSIDRALTDSTSSSQHVENESLFPPVDFIRYEGAANDDVYDALTKFPPLEAVYAAASKSIEFEDSIARERNADALTEPGDSLLVLPLRSRAYDIIMAYKRQAESGFPATASLPQLLQLDRAVQSADSSHLLLPDANSKWLSHGNFFFLGGAPFIQKPYTEKDTIYTDPAGRPEARFISDVSENGKYAIASLLHFKKEGVRLRFGPPLRFYYGNTWEAGGIGSVIHEFVNRIPVLFLTENGFVPAHVIDIETKVHPENVGCDSDQPRLQFACAENLDPLQILAVYIPYDQAPTMPVKINRPSSNLWTADLNNDGTPEIACVSSTFAGSISDTMAHCIWYVNINGTWKVIDSAEELDCT